MRSVQPLRRLSATVLAAAILVVVAGPPAVAQPVTLGKEAYLTPPKEIMDAVLAARNENVTLTNLSPDGKKFLITKNDGLPPLQRMARPCAYLGEMAFDPVAGRARDLWVRSAPGFDLFFHADKRVTFRLCLDGSERLPVTEQQIISFASLQ